MKSKRKDVRFIMKIKYESTLEFHAKNNNKEYLLNEFSHKNTKSPKELMCGSTKPIWWNCPNCNSEYDMGIYYRVKLNCNCPFCAGKRVNDTNSLAVIHPELVNEWNYVKNINLTPNDVCHSSSRKVWWICTEGHEWKVSISNRTINGNGCPFCAKRKVGKDNNLLTTHQEICKDWNYEKNIIKPIDVSFSYKKPVWWKCSIGHEYKKTVYDKVRFPECPHCNSIVVKHPELLKEWDFERNIINPLDISFSSGKKVFWKCSNNEEHIWQASPHKRNVGRGCPFL
jgi:hypothetical protein